MICTLNTLCNKTKCYVSNKVGRHYPKVLAAPGPIFVLSFHSVLTLSMTRLVRKLLWNILWHFCILLVSGQLLVKVQSKGRRGDCVAGDSFYSRGSRESKAWYLLEANHTLLLTKDTEECFSSLFSHEHNDPSLPSVLQ